jgi:hypothetical protein
MGEPISGHEPAPPDTRQARIGLTLGRLARPLPIAIPILIVVCSLIGGGTLGGGLALAAIALAVFAYRAWRAASQEAFDIFFAAYAASRGLEDAGPAGLPPATPLLRAGRSQGTRRVLRGVLPGGLEGAVALYTYEASAGSGEGEVTTPHHFTLVLYHLPQMTTRMGEVYCEPRRPASRASDHRAAEMQPLHLESVELDRRIEIFHGPDEDPVWLRQLFSPTLVNWLAEESPPRFGFEISDGALCAFVPGHTENAAGLDRLIATADAVAARVQRKVAA